MNITPADAKNLADQVVTVANQLATSYIRKGLEVPPPSRLFIEAQCVWTVQLLNEIMSGVQVAPPPVVRQ